MKALLKFELQNYFKSIGFYVLMIMLIIFGAITGSKFLLSVGPDIFKNSPYTVAYMTGFLSLFCIFFSTLPATQILFKEKDSNFSLILYATPIRQVDYLLSRFLAVSLLSIICFVLLMLGFVIGQQSVSDRSSYTQFNIFYYLRPILVFGFVNTFFCCAVLCSVSWFTKNKLMVYVTGLLIYILYMVMLIFSGSPLMAQGMPQSEQALHLSASLDPFGLSGFFLQTRNWSVLQRNTELIVPSGTFIWNRIGVVFVSILSLSIAFKGFSFSTSQKINPKKIAENDSAKPISGGIEFNIVQPSYDWRYNWAALASFTKMNISYITKSIPFLLTCIVFLFYIAMEMYGNIEKGIRIPQQYASSGLMAKTIIDNFPGLCLIVIVYYAHEIFWRSRNNNFHLIENSTPAGSGSLFFSKWLTLSILSISFTTLMILLGILFQFSYHYSHINWTAYAGVYLFVPMPLILSAGIILIIQRLVNQKYIGLIVSSGIALFTATSMGNQLLQHPLLRFQIPYNGLYSDMNGFGSYTGAYGWRLLFGIAVVVIVSILVTQLKKLSAKPLSFLVIIALMIISFVSGKKVIEDYQSGNEEAVLTKQAEYEKKYRRFQTMAQPTVIDIKTNIDLFPEKDAYQVKADYILQNKTHQRIDSILINFADKIDMQEAGFSSHGQSANLKNQYSVIALKEPLLPGDSAQFSCKFSYHWAAVNGHTSFNAIVQNGSFIRLSRYFPSIGYLWDNEIEAEGDRKKYHLGEPTPLTTVEAPRIITDDFVKLKMTISTSNDQIAIGVGELTKKWNAGDRNYFQYNSPSPVPFHFAVSSARYAVATALYRGKTIEVYYHPTHSENVAHLINNIKLTLKYCETNFGAYPFTTIRFAEVSAFTRGFAATAYPATIFMTENMIFNANISADQNQDVVNELSGHELAHIWWGNSQISPDRREGGRMLTETLAMYTELMLVKKMHGKKRVMENVRLHQGIYLNERGFSKEQALFKVHYGNIQVLYSKGLVVMYQLHELIGEEKLNLALRNFLRKYAHPANAISIDFIHELYAVTDSTLHASIDDLFKKITLFDFKTKNTSIKKSGTQYELVLNATADKYYEDGKGNRTKAAFNNTVEVAFYFEEGKEKIYKLPIVNNEIALKILFDKKPTAIEFDPDIKYIKIESGRQLIK